MQSLGDMAQTLVLRHNQTQLRSQVGRLGAELTTGVVSDRAAHLGGDLTALATLDRSLTALEGFRVATAEATYIADVMQNALGQLQSRVETLGPRLMQTDLLVSESNRAGMATESRNALDVAVANLNVAAGGRFVFGGVATDRPAMAGADTILAALRSEIAGETTIAGIEARLDAWFDAPGGGFETIAYTGSTTSVAETRLSATSTARLDVRADDPVFRDTLKALSLAALSTDPAIGFPRELQAEMLHSSGTKMLNIQTPLIDLRAGVGDLQARIDETSTQNASEKTSTELARLRLIGIDQYDTAVRLQDAQLQLEALYSVTARAARLSFVEFMR